MNTTKPYAIVDLKTSTVVRRFAGLRAAVDCADRKGDGFVMAFIYGNGDVALNGTVFCKVAA